MVNTRKSSKSVVKGSSETKQTGKKSSDSLAAKPQIPNPVKPKMPIKKKASPLVAETSALPGVKVSDGVAASSNPKVGVVERKGPEPAAKQKEVPSQPAEKPPKQTGASSTPSSTVPPPILPQSEVTSNPTAPVDFSLHVKEAVVEKKKVIDSGEASRAVVGKVSVDSVEVGEPGKPVSKVSVGSKTWREKIHASGYVRPSGLRRKVVNRRVETPRKFLAKISAVRGRLATTAGPEAEQFPDFTSKRKVTVVEEPEDDTREEHESSGGKQQAKNHGGLTEKYESSKRDDELDELFNDIDAVVENLQKEVVAAVPMRAQSSQAKEAEFEDAALASSPESGKEASVAEGVPSGCQHDAKIALSQENSGSEAESVEKSVPVSVQGRVEEDDVMEDAAQIVSLSDTSSEDAQDVVPLAMLRKEKIVKKKQKIVVESPAKKVIARDAEVSEAAGEAIRAKKRKRETPVPAVEEPPVGIVKKGIWFASKDAARKWKAVQRRKIIPERLLDEARYKGKEVVHILKRNCQIGTLTKCKPFDDQLIREAMANLPPQFGVVGDKDFGVVYVRGRRIEINPDLINTFFQMDDPEVDEEEADYDKIVDTITASSVPWWPETVVPTADLSTFYSMLFFIAVFNWKPSSHRSTVSKDVAQLIYQIGNKMLFNLGRVMFKQIAEHATSTRSLHQICFPSLIYELIINRAPELNDPNCHLSKAPQKFSVDHKLFKGRHVNDLKEVRQRGKDIPESSRRGGARMARGERDKLIKELDIIIAAAKEQRKHINSLARALRYPSDDEEDASATEDGDSDDLSSA